MGKSAVQTFYSKALSMFQILRTHARVRHLCAVTCICIAAFVASLLIGGHAQVHSLSQPGGVTPLGRIISLLIPISLFSLTTPGFEQDYSCHARKGFDLAWNLGALTTCLLLGVWLGYWGNDLYVLAIPRLFCFLWATCIISRETLGARYTWILPSGATLIFGLLIPPRVKQHLERSNVAKPCVVCLGPSAVNHTFGARHQAFSNFPVLEFVTQHRPAGSGIRNPTLIYPF